MNIKQKRALAFLENWLVLQTPLRVFCCAKDSAVFAFTGKVSEVSDRGVVFDTATQKDFLRLLTEHIYSWEYLRKDELSPHIQGRARDWGGQSIEALLIGEDTNIVCRIYALG